MAVTFGINRLHQSFDSTTFSEFCVATLSGTYATGGFTWNPFTIYGGKGSLSLPSTNFLAADFYSPTGHTYATTISGNTATTKIFSGTTELSNGAAVPNATLNVTVRKRKI